MSLYILIPLLACVSSSVLATALLFRDPAERTNRLAAVFVGGATVWSFCEVLWNAQPRADAALALVRASALGWVWIGPLALHLFLRITGEDAPRSERALPFLYAAAASFLLLDWFTPWVHPAVVPTAWGWSYEFGPLYPLFYALTVGSIAVALRIGWHVYHVTGSPAERDQARLLGGGIAIPLVVASATDGLLPFVGVHVPHLGSLSFALLGATIAWSFHRYGYSLLAPGTFASEILETLPDGVAMLRLDGRIRRANGAMARMLSREANDVVGLSLPDRLSSCPTDLAAELVEWQCELETFSGAHTPVSISSTVLRDKRGSPIGLVLVVRDLREVVSLRNRLVVSGRLAAVGELAAGIAHEINNPLAYVRANLGLLRQHWDAVGAELGKLEPSDEAKIRLAEGEELLDESLTGVDRAAAIVRDVRGLSHAGLGERQTADLHQLLDGVLRMVAPQLPANTMVEKRYGEVPPVRCSPPELQQVFLNLVLNAGQAIGEGGTIRLRTWCDGAVACVSVEDDGCGIPADVASRIFDPFFTTKPVGEGTGLGLGIAHEIVRRHGGEIDVESEPGRGSRFRVRLPIDAATLAA